MKLHDPSDTLNGRRQLLYSAGESHLYLSLVTGDLYVEGEWREIAVGLWSHYQRWATGRLEIDDPEREYGR